VAETFALAVTDRNQAEIKDAVSRDVLCAIPGNDFGEGPIFLDLVAEGCEASSKTMT
jgi:hypothetical protein